MKFLIFALALTPVPAMAAGLVAFGTAQTCRGDFSGEAPVMVIGQYLFDPTAICTLDGHCADPTGRTWVDLVSVTIDGEKATVTYEDGAVDLVRCE